MPWKALLATCLLCLALLLTLPALAADPDYWVSYQISASVRTPPATAWTPFYSGPFGVSVGYATGTIFSDQTVTDPTQPNCFDFAFAPNASNGLTSMRQEITVTEYHGNSLCGAADPSQVQTLAVIDMTVGQNQTNSFQFPYFGGQQIQINLGQSWAVPQSTR